MLRFSTLKEIVGGHTVSFDSDRNITSLLLDSRKVPVNPDETLFLAINGERHDGHEFVQQLYNVGVRQFVVEAGNSKLIGKLPYANVIEVKSSIIALQAIAAHHRSKFSIPVIGITGSNGKTIIKEWLFQVLSQNEVVVKNPGSYNSQIGVPLSVWQMESHHTLGIFEAGISKPGEMERLEAVIRPTIGIFTNIGTAHSEGFTSIEQKVHEKLMLFKNCDWILYRKDHELIDRCVQNFGVKNISWGFQPGADIFISNEGAAYVISHSHHIYELTIPFEDSASIENCLHVICLMIAMGYSNEVIEKGVAAIKAVPMRLELKEGINHSYIIDDTYNNDLAGIEISVQFLRHQQQRRRKSIILSDVLESGLDDATLSKSIARLINHHEIVRFVGIGPRLSANSELFDSNALFYKSTEDFLANFDTSLIENEVVLVKGARVFQFERVVNKIQRKVHGTVMEIDLGALIHNFNLVKHRLDKSTRVMVMVKAFAYGSGSNEVANLLQYHKADYLGVAYPDEGVELRKNNIKLPIMVMNPSLDSFEQMLAFDLEPEIYSFRILDALVKILNNRSCSIHLKIDTGMHRLGFEEQEITEVIGVLTKNKNIRVASVFSHLAGADESTHDDFSRRQCALFKKCADMISDGIGYRPLYHILNSPGILRFPEFQFNMVRLGIGLYGVDPTEMKTGFRPVATLKTQISQVKAVKSGESIGYGRRGQVTQESKIATIAIGYADGYSRAFSRGRGKVLIKGRLAPVVGNVCMDMTMVDVTGIEASEGDEVIVFGKDLPIEQVAANIDTIPYEILTNTSERVKRVFTSEGL